VTRRLVRWLNERTGSASFIHRSLRYAFPDHWSFLLGEVALYAFIVLVATGIYLTFFFDPSTSPTVYHGSYGPLDGVEMTRAYRSVLNISFDVKAGLLIRQTHHWAADVFVASIVLHLMRVFFTGAYRKPRDVTYVIGVVILFVSLLEGFLGYSLGDDLLSGMGLAIAYSVALSIPFIGANMGQLIWGGQFPGTPDFWPRMYIGHVLLIPLLIATLLTAHLALVASRHHTQFAGRGRSERKLIGVPSFPGQAPRSLGLFAAVAAALVLLGGLIQINPVWLWGPYHVGSATNGAQPDWYLGWLIGALRIVPSFDVVIANRTVVPNPFWGGALFPLAVMTLLLAWPWLERKFSGDYGVHNLLQRPRDNPTRTGLGAAVLSLAVLVFLAGSADRVFVFIGLDYGAQIWFYRFAVVLLPPLIFWVTRRFCRALLEADRVDAIQHAAEEEAKAEARASPAL
jgi:ubiquinol-cytochrome c reductase cytochrome b subunit